MLPRPPDSSHSLTHELLFFFNKTRNHRHTAHTPRLIAHASLFSASVRASQAPSSYRAVYSSLHKITLDNNNLAQPALSVSARGGGISPRNASHIARTVRALMATDWREQEAAEAAEAMGRNAAREIETSLSPLVCPGAVSLGCASEGGVLRRAGATEAAVELARFANLPAACLHAPLRDWNLSTLKAFAEHWGVTLSSTADLVAYARTQEKIVERCGPPAQVRRPLSLLASRYLGTPRGCMLTVLPPALMLRLLSAPLALLSTDPPHVPPPDETIARRCPPSLGGSWRTRTARCSTAPSTSRSSSRRSARAMATVTAAAAQAAQTAPLLQQQQPQAA